MKRILLACTAALLLASCSKQGEIEKEPVDFIIIHGKTYKLMKVVPADGANAIWIMYPKDSLDKMPTSINYNVQQGKITTNHTIVKVD